MKSTEKNSRREEKKKERDKGQKKEDTGARNVRKVAKHFVFPMICGSGGSKSRFAKAAGAEPPGQRRNEKLQATVAGSTFASQSKMLKRLTVSAPFASWDVENMARRCGAKHISKMNKTHQVGTIFGISDVEKLYAAVGAKHMSKMKKKQTRLGPVLEVRMWEKWHAAARRCTAKHISN